MSAVRVHLAAITTFHYPVEGFLVFAHPTTVSFLKGLGETLPSYQTSYPGFGTLVLRCLIRLPFEPMMTCSLRNLFLKMAFLVAITSAQRIGERDDTLFLLSIFQRRFGYGPYSNSYLKCHLNFLLTSSLISQFSSLSRI